MRFVLMGRLVLLTVKHVFCWFARQGSSCSVIILAALWLHDLLAAAGCRCVVKFACAVKRGAPAWCLRQSLHWQYAASRPQWVALLLQRVSPTCPTCCSLILWQPQSCQDSQYVVDLIQSQLHRPLFCCSVQRTLEYVSECPSA
jgi:hypothetical protein